MEEDTEAVRAVDWDRSAADAAYRAEVERAQERARLVRPQPGLRRPSAVRWRSSWVVRAGYKPCKFEG